MIPQITKSVLWQVLNRCSTSAVSRSSLFICPHDNKEAAFLRRSTLEIIFENLCLFGEQNGCLRMVADPERMTEMCFPKTSGYAWMGPSTQVSNSWKLNKLIRPVTSNFIYELLRLSADGCTSLLSMYFCQVKYMLRTCPFACKNFHCLNIYKLLFWVANLFTVLADFVRPWNI